MVIGKKLRLPDKYQKKLGLPDEYQKKNEDYQTDTEKK